MYTPRDNESSSDCETAGAPFPGPTSGVADTGASANVPAHSPLGTSSVMDDPSIEVELPSTSTAPDSIPWWDSKGFRIGLTLTMMVIAVVIVSRAIEPGQIAQAFAHINLWWFAAAVVMGLLGWVGSAIPLRVFSPLPIPFKNALLLQMASSFVSVVAPAGVGFLALSLRFLYKRGLTSAQAVATMMLITISQIVTSAVLILVALFLLEVNPDVRIPWKTVGWVLLAVFTLVLLIFAIPKTRAAAIKSVSSVWEEAYPQAVWAIRHPRQLLLAMGGAVILSFSFIFGLWFSLLAFGQYTSLLELAAVFLVFNTLGAAIPVPGGIGAVEGALTVGLATLGVPGAVALSAVLIFRLAIFYSRIPIGAIAYAYIQREGLI